MKHKLRISWFERRNKVFVFGMMIEIQMYSGIQKYYEQFWLFLATTNYQIHE